MKGQKTGGRAKGVPNKATADVRATIALIAERNVEKLETWLTEVGANDPAKAADLYLRMIEYHIPKLSRAEHSGPNGSAIPTTLRLELVKPK